MNPPDNKTKNLRIYRFLIEIVGTQCNSFDCIFAVVVAGYDDDFGFGGERQDIL